jgi:hypothetical protein
MSGRTHVGGYTSAEHLCVPPSLVQRVLADSVPVDAWQEEAALANVLPTEACCNVGCSTSSFGSSTDICIDDIHAECWRQQRGQVLCLSKLSMPSFDKHGTSICSRHKETIVELVDSVTLFRAEVTRITTLSGRNFVES